MPLAGQKRKRAPRHAYLSGNFAPIQRTRQLTPCTYIGRVPQELAGGQYVRNGGNPVSNDDLGRDAHWFDGDGMLAGVLFESSVEGDTLVPHFVNQYILTDVNLSANSSRPIRTPILPSISSLVNPASPLLYIVARIFRTLILTVLSWVLGSAQRIKRISVANTAVLYHDGRALATCESGPPMRIQLPELQTVGWYNGDVAEGEPLQYEDGQRLGGDGLIGFMKEWTTGHPKVDPLTQEMILFHCTFIQPFVRYSVIPASRGVHSKSHFPKQINIPVPGVSGGKMMHDFGVSRSHTVIMDLPLSLDPFNLLKQRPVVSYDPHEPARFGVFPRRDPSKIRWFETSACCIFHTANTWDTYNKAGQVTEVNLLACRLNSATLVFSAGNVAAPPPPPGPLAKGRQRKPLTFSARYDNEKAYRADDPDDEENPLLRHISPMASTSELEKALQDDEQEEQCRLYLYTFSMTEQSPTIKRQFALSRLPFEFPTLNNNYAMASARYIYGCSTFTSTFGAALGQGTKIDILLKMDVHTLIRKGRDVSVPDGGCVDNRNVWEIISSSDENDAIKAFQMPQGWYAQEASFVPRSSTTTVAEDDGYLLFYAFDESQLDKFGECGPDAKSELWIVDAKNMVDVIARVQLPQRVPYGLHGNWFSKSMIRNQRPVGSLRRQEYEDVKSWTTKCRDWVKELLG